MKELKNVKYFEQWSAEQNMEMIVEGKIGDLLKKAGKGLVDAFNKIEGNTPVERVKKFMKNPGVVNLLAKNGDYDAKTLKTAFAAAEKVNWKLEDISDEKQKEVASFLLGLGKEKYDKAKAGEGSQYGVTK